MSHKAPLFSGGQKGAWRASVPNKVHGLAELTLGTSKPNTPFSLISIYAKQYVLTFSMCEQRAPLGHDYLRKIRLRVIFQLEVLKHD